ncbi:hypothetical protein BROUX41_003398 [Berkeleyomyces rouxiae]|uniref:uncharacterized protein n=1 Tax=Berkeleyomyces rouxiae TaxID=2035830 RepID=UPI003B78222B
MKMVPAGLRLHDPAMASLLAVGAALVALPALYAGLASAVQPRLPTLRNKRICLLIAHPDDEAMFFAPTVLALTRPETGNHVKILCLSSGDADGLGETRKKELQKSAVLLGLRAENDVFVVENPDFPDSMTAHWDKDKISMFLARLFTTRSPASQVPVSNIDVLITFDQHGISSHPNHISLFHGAQTFVSTLAHLTAGSDAEPPVDLYTLTTVGMLRKYAGFHDAFTSLALWLGRGAGFVSPAASATDTHADDARNSPASLLFLSPFRGSPTAGAPSVSRARAAMTQAHVSQMRWFRWGWITLSRYMYLNDLRLVRPTTLEPSNSSGADGATTPEGDDETDGAVPEVSETAKDAVAETETHSRHAKREKEKEKHAHEPERTKQRHRQDKAAAAEVDAETSKAHKSERKHKKHSTKKSKK